MSFFSIHTMPKTLRIITFWSAFQDKIPRVWPSALTLLGTYKKGEIQLLEKLVWSQLLKGYPIIFLLTIKFDKMRNIYCSKALSNAAQTTSKYVILHWICRWRNLCYSSSVSIQTLAAKVFWLNVEVCKVWTRLKTLKFRHFLFTFFSQNFTT